MGMMSNEPLRNRVNPWGQLCSVRDRGQLMGNRGILHDEHNQIVRPWAHKAWVTCQIAFRGIKRPQPFSRGNYSELFFLDEATSFAAGHRPCAYCQRGRFKAFKAAWLSSNAMVAESTTASIATIDNKLHEDRAIRGGGKRTFEATVADLPMGAMFAFELAAYLVTSRGCLPWSFGGYGSPVDFGASRLVTVLTPQSVVRTFESAFTPRVHSSATG